MVSHSCTERSYIIAYTPAIGTFSETYKISKETLDSRKNIKYIKNLIFTPPPPREVPVKILKEFFQTGPLFDKCPELTCLIKHNKFYLNENGFVTLLIVWLFLNANRFFIHQIKCKEGHKYWT